MEYALGLIASCVFMYFSLKRGEQNRQSTIEAAFDGRQASSPQEFYDKYYKTKNIPAEIVLGVKKILEKHLDVDLSRLKCSDNFLENLSFFWNFDSMANVEIVIALEKSFDIKIEDSEAEKAKTVDDIIMVVAGKLKTSALKQ